MDRLSLKSHLRHATGSPTVAARHVHARLSRKRGTQLPLPFLRTPSIVKICARRRRSAADHNRGGITARLPQRRPVAPLPAPPREGRSPGPAHSSRDTVEHQGQPRLSGVFPRTRHETMHERLCRSGRKLHSPLPRQGTHRTLPHIDTHHRMPGQHRLHRASPRRHSRRGTRDPIAPQKGSEATPPKKDTHRVPLHVDTPSNARARRPRPRCLESSLDQTRDEESRRLPRRRTRRHHHTLPRESRPPAPVQASRHTPNVTDRTGGTSPSQAAEETRHRGTPCGGCAGARTGTRAPWGVTPEPATVSRETLNQDRYC